MYLWIARIAIFFKRGLQRRTRSVLCPPHTATVGFALSILAALGCFVFSPPAFASIGVWTYAGQNYPTQAAAVAAMQAATPQNSVLTVMAGITNMSAAVVQYKYIAAPQSPSLGSVGWYAAPTDSGQSLGTYTSMASAMTAMEQYYNGGCGPGVLTLYYHWPPSNLTYPGYIYEAWSYTVTETILPPQCVVTPGVGALIWSTQPYFCPTNYSLVVSQTGAVSCTNAQTDSIYHQLLECPSNGSPSTSVGDPCDVSNGDFSQTESDYSGVGLSFQRYYHSAVLESSHALGVGWTHNYAAYLVLASGVPAGLLRPDGHHDALIASDSGVYISLSGAGIHVVASGSQWVAYRKNGTEEIYSSTGQLQEIITPNGLVTTLAYNSNGQLSSASDAFGHSLQFGYNINNQIGTVVEPDGSSIVYGYDTNNNLTTATYPDKSVRTYQYSNSTFPNNLTGILDELKQQFLTVMYDPTTGAVTSSYQGGSSIQAQLVSITYSANGAVAKDALSATHTYVFTNNAGYMPRASSLVVNGEMQSFGVAPPSRDVQQRVTQYTDANNNIATYAYDANHLTAKIDAFGTSVARTTSYQTYQDTLTSLPTLIVEPLRQTAYAYYSGTYQLHTKTVTDTTVSPNISRTWTYTYTSSGQVQTVDGPRTDVSDVTTYTYYTCTIGVQCGQINTIKDAAGHITIFNTYNGHGQPLTITDPNGILTTLAYDGRQRLLSSQVGTEKTSYQYYANGLLQQVTAPDASTIQYTYDAAHRLTQVTDELGNYIKYTLDAMGNRTGEQSYDPSNVLHRSHTRQFNVLNELHEDINAAGTAAVTTTYGYDSNHNQSSIDAPLSRNTGYLFDPLNRLHQITDPMSGITKMTYDANDKILTVEHPRSLVTTYANNGFGDVSELASPDTGSSVYTYDSGGNVHSTKDARGALATYSYDAMNRETSVVYNDQTISFTYDSGTNGKGHLTGASDANHTMAWTYDPQGRVNGKSQIVASVTKAVGYTYTNADLQYLVTPSGQTITYGYNSNHQITSIQVGTTMLLSSVTYDPLGPITGWTWGNGSTSTRSFDKDGNPSSIVTAGTTNVYTPDYAGRITQITDSTLSSNTWNFTSYDALDRIKAASSSAKSRGYTYDANGNRLTATGTTPVTLSISTANNQIIGTTGGITRTYSYDNAGNASYTGEALTFNDRGRMSEAVTSGGTTNYIYNALGQLIEKSGDGGTTILVYDEAGHVLGEYSSTGALIEETIWMGNMPVATLRPNGSTGCTSTLCIFYVHTDHLGSPRKVTMSTSANGLMWRWDPDTFGSSTSSPNQDPAGLGTFVYNLRFSGQYALPESGLNYNYFRTYDPATGRYIESDPIGLRGGINTYTYAKDSPIMHTDPSGLFSLDFNVTVTKNFFVTNGDQGHTSSRVTHLKCSCTPACGNNWQLKGCSGTLQVNVEIQILMDGISTAVALHDEQQHVNDYGGARDVIERIVTQKENTLKSTQYPDEESCADSAQAAITPILLDLQKQVASDSYLKYDQPGGPHGH